MPIVGADNNKFVPYLDTESANGLVGAAVTNPPPVGGAGLNLALKVKAGQPSTRSSLTPRWGQHPGWHGEDQGCRRSELNDYYGVTYNIPAWSGLREG